MRLALALGVAFAAMTLAAEAQPDNNRQVHRIEVRAFGGGEVDANSDGFISRDEATAGAERAFGEFDRNDDGKLDDADTPDIAEFNVRVESSGDGRVIIERDGQRTERVIRQGENEGEDGERVVRVIRNGEEVHVERGEGEDERDVRVIVTERGGGEWTSETGDVIRIAPVPPVPPVAPVYFISTSSTEEFDRNGDGALSLDEFRTQQMRQFDASDGNGDGRIRAVRPPTPPTPPTAPTPPTPPRRR